MIPKLRGTIVEYDWNLKEKLYLEVDLFASVKHLMQPLIKRVCGYESEE